MKSERERETNDCLSVRCVDEYVRNENKTKKRERILLRAFARWTSISSFFVVACARALPLRYINAFLLFLISHEQISDHLSGVG